MKKITILILTVIVSVNCKAQIKHKTIVHHFKDGEQPNYGDVDEMNIDDNGTVVIYHDKRGNKVIDSIGFEKHTQPIKKQTKVKSAKNVSVISIGQTGGQTGAIITNNYYHN